MHPPLQLYILCRPVPLQRPPLGCKMVVVQRQTRRCVSPLPPPPTFNSHSYDIGLAGVWTDRGACLGYDDDDDEDCEDEDDAGTSGAGSLRIARYVDEDEEKEEAEELAPAVPTRTVHRSRWFRF